jgi:PAS domain S-box-containing protein
MTAVDLSQCEQEPIHIPGAIQAHGLLIAVHSATLQITQISANGGKLLGMPLDKLLKQPLGTVLGAELEELVVEALRRYREFLGEPASFTWLAPHLKTTFTGYVHEMAGMIILELEPLLPVANSIQHLLSHTMREFCSIRAHKTLQIKLHAAAQLFQRLTGYDRVMIYRFDVDFHGEVVAEARRDDLEAYLGLHYPASDIPAQARRLFLISPTRIIVDVDAPSVPLMPLHDPIHGEPLDLSRSILRSVSEVHLEYLRNMGVQATLTAPLIRNGQLWGLIACHHYSSKAVVGDIRQITGWIAQDLSNEIALSEEIETRENAFYLKHCRDYVLNAMREGIRLSNLLQAPYLEFLLGIAGAQGVALVRNQAIDLGGITPSIDDVRLIVDALIARHLPSNQRLFVTECLYEQLADMERLAATAAGLVLIVLDHSPLTVLIWFRGEQIRHVIWGGNPDKAVNISPDGRLSPRQSFAAWATMVHARSQRWSQTEIDSIRELSVLIDIEWRKTAEEALRASEQRLQSVLDGANDGFWDWDMITEEVLFSPRWVEMLGYQCDEIQPHIQSWKQRMHPEDQPRCQAALQAHSLGTASRYECEHRLRHKNGQWRWMLARGKIITRDHTGNPVRIAGTMTDVTDRHLAEEALRNSLNEIKRHDTQMSALNRMNDLLLSCETCEEAYPIIAQGAASLFAPWSGGLAIFQHPNAQQLERVVSWGDNTTLAVEFFARDCWALRRGELHAVMPEHDEIHCHHFSESIAPPGYFCVPLTVRGFVFGLFHVSIQNITEDLNLKELQTLIITFSESIKLALSNLKFQETLHKIDDRGRQSC